MTAGFLVIVAQWSEHWQLQCSIMTLFHFTCKCLAPVLGLTLQEKSSRSFFCLWGPPLKIMTSLTSFPSILDYCKRSKTGRWKGLETRLNLTKNRDYSLPDQQQCPFCCIPLYLHGVRLEWVANLCSCSIPVVVSSHDRSCSL